MRIAVVGKYVELKESYKSLNEALHHGGIANDARWTSSAIEGEEIEGRDPATSLGDCHGILVPGGFGVRGIEGKIAAIQYAREKKVPFFGICLGMQMASVEFARNVAGLAGADSTEFDGQRQAPGRSSSCAN